MSGSRVHDLSENIVSIIEFSDDAIVSKDLNGIVLTWNRGAERLFGYTVEDMVGKSIAILIPEDRHDEESMILQRIREGEPIDHYETIRRRKDGSLVEISLSVSPVKNAEGQIIGASKIARDITGRKQAEDRSKLLAREADHRSKNLLSIILAILHLTRAETVEQFKHAVEGRIRAVANVHGLLGQSKESNADLRSLIVAELAPYHDRHRSIDITGPSVVLDHNAAQLMGIAVHELATNAVKYGALSVQEGRVQVQWSRATHGHLALRWTELNGPPVTPPDRKGFGTEIMEKLIRGHLNAEIHFDWRAAGLVCEIMMSTPH